MNRFNLVFYSH